MLLLSDQAREVLVSRDALLHYVDTLNIDAPGSDDEKVGVVFARFAKLAGKGYDLSKANGSIATEVLKAFGKFPKYFDYDQTRATSRTFYKDNEKETICEVVVKASAGGKRYEHVHDGKSALNAACVAFGKLVKESYGDQGPIEPINVLDALPEPLMTKMVLDRKTGDFQLPVRVTITFGMNVGGRDIVFAMQDVREDTPTAAAFAVGKGREFGLFLQGMHAK